MSPRTKGDFLNYARSSQARSGQPEIYYTGNFSGTKNAIANVHRTDESDDGSIAVSVSEPTTNVSTTADYQRSSYESAGSEQGTDGGDDSFYSGSNGFNDNNGNYDIPIRNYNPSPNTTVERVQSGPARVKTRTSFLDDAFGKIKRSTQKAVKPKPAQVVKAVRKLLTIGEATENRQMLIELVMWTSDNLDNGITAITRHHRQVEIWSNIEYADAEILVDAFLDAGKKSERWANAVRQVIDLNKRIKIGVILLPRAYRSIMYTIVTGIDLRLTDEDFVRQ